MNRQFNGVDLADTAPSEYEWTSTNFILKNYRWRDDLQLHDSFNSISVMLSQWKDDNDRLCAMEPHYKLKRILPPVGFELLPVA